MTKWTPDSPSAFLESMRTDVGMTVHPSLSTVQECLRRINCTSPAAELYRDELVREALEVIAEIARLAGEDTVR